MRRGTIAGDGRREEISRSRDRELAALVSPPTPLSHDPQAPTTAADAPNKTRSERSLTLPVNASAAAESSSPASNRMREQHRTSVLILGAPGVGRASLARRFAVGKWEPTKPPQDAYRKTMKVSKRDVTIEVASATGAFDNPLVVPFIRMSNAVVIAMSQTDASSLQAAREYHAKVQLVKGLGRKVHCVLVANKSDVASKERVLKRSDCESLARELGNVPFFEVSAKTGANVDSAFITLIKSVLPAGSPPVAQRREQQRITASAKTTTTTTRSPFSMFGRGSPKANANGSPPPAVHSPPQEKKASAVVSVRLSDGQEVAIVDVC